METREDISWKGPLGLQSNCLKNALQEMSMSPLKTMTHGMEPQREQMTALGANCRGLQGKRYLSPPPAMNLRWHIIQNTNERELSHRPLHTQDLVVDCG